MWVAISFYWVSAHTIVIEAANCHEKYIYAEKGSNHLPGELLYSFFLVDKLANALFDVENESVSSMYFSVNSLIPPDFKSTIHLSVK